MRRVTKRLLLLLICIAGALRAEVWAAQDRPPNILLILADDMGWTDAGYLGSDLYRTPHLDALAKQSVKFTDSYAACHVCSPTRASIMTGKYPARLHLTDFIAGGRDRGLRSPPWTKYLPLREVTIAEALREVGYVCGHFGKWHLNRDKDYRPGRPRDPGSQGFDVVLTTHKPKSDDDPMHDPHHVDQITAAATKFIDDNRSRPFFCYVSHNTLHRPVIGHPDLASRFEPRITSRTRHANAQYAAMVHDLDQSIARLLSKLDELRLADRTVVIFTSDNGGFLGDEKDRVTSNYPLRDGKGTNYEGGVRVPTLVRWPGVVVPGAVCDEPIISNDFYPTLLEIGGAEGNAEHHANMDGLSLVPLLRNASATLPRDALYWHYPHYHAAGATPHGAIRVGHWKLIEFYEDGHLELYDLSQDIGETSDLAGTLPKKAFRLRQRLASWRRTVGAQMPTVPVSAE